MACELDAALVRNRNREGMEPSGHDQVERHVFVRLEDVAQPRGNRRRVLDLFGRSQPTPDPPAPKRDHDARADGPRAERVRLEHLEVEEAARREGREQEAELVEVAEELEQRRARVEQRHFAHVLDDHEPHLADASSRDAADDEPRAAREDQRARVAES